MLPSPPLNDMRDHMSSPSSHYPTRCSGCPSVESVPMLDAELSGRGGTVRPGTATSGAIMRGSVASLIYGGGGASSPNIFFYFLPLFIKFFINLPPEVCFQNLDPWLGISLIGAEVIHLDTSTFNA